MTKLTERQQGFIVDELQLSKAEIGEILGKPVSKIAELTRAQAFDVISKSLDDLALHFHPGATISINIRVTEPDDGLPCTFHGIAKVKSYQIHMGPEGAYLNAVIHIPSLDRTIKRSLPYLKKHAVRTEADESGEENAQDVLQKYHRVQEWSRWLHKNIQRIWTKMLNASALPSRALENSTLSVPLKIKLINAIIGQLEAYHSETIENLNDENVHDVIREVAGFVLFD